MRQMNRGRLNLLPPAGLDVTWARAQDVSPLRGSERKLSCAVGGRKRAEREREEEEGGSSSGQLMGKGIKDEEVTVKVEKRIFTAVREVRQQQHD